MLEVYERVRFAVILAIESPQQRFDCTAKQPAIRVDWNLFADKSKILERISVRMELEFLAVRSGNSCSFCVSILIILQIVYLFIVRSFCVLLTLAHVPKTRQTTPQFYYESIHAKKLVALY